MRVRKISYRTTRNEATRCYFCKNNCLRTFIDVKMTELTRRRRQPLASGTVHRSQDGAREVRLEGREGRRRAAPDHRDLREGHGRRRRTTMRGIKAGLDAIKKANPNFVEIAAKEPFRPRGAAERSPIRCRRAPGPTSGARRASS